MRIGHVLRSLVLTTDRLSPTQDGTKSKPSWKQFWQHPARSLKHCVLRPLKCILEICSSELVADIYKELSESAVRMLISSKTLGITK